MPEGRSGKRPQRCVQFHLSVKHLVVLFVLLGCSGRVVYSDSQYLSHVCCSFCQAYSAIAWEARLLDQRMLTVVWIRCWYWLLRLLGVSDANFPIKEPAADLAVVCLNLFCVVLFVLVVPGSSSPPSSSQIVLSIHSIADASPGNRTSCRVP